MQKLLRSEIFDVFLLLEGTVITSCSYTIDGRLQKEFYTMEEWKIKVSVHMSLQNGQI